MITLVLLPGMDGTGLLFAEFVANYPEAQIISYPTDVAMNYDELLSRVVAQIPQATPFVVVGESFSGPVAISLAAKNLPLLRGLVLVCSFAKLPRANVLRRLFPMLQFIPFWHAPVRLSTLVLGGRFMSTSVRLQFAQALKRVTPRVWQARVRAVMTVDVSLALSKLAIPILYLRATEDRVVSRSASEHVLSLNRNAKRVDIEGPHLLLQTQPLHAANAIREFVKSL